MSALPPSRDRRPWAASAGDAGEGRGPPDGDAQRVMWGLLVAFEHHLATARGLCEDTVRAYTGDMRGIMGRATRLGLFAPEAWTADVLGDLLAHGKNRLGTGAASARTTARKHSALRAFFTWYQAGREDAVDPTDTLIGPDQIRRKPRPVALLPVLALLQPAADPAADDPQAAAAMVLLYGLGLLLGEAERLPAAAVDMAANRVEVGARERRPRRIPIPLLARPPLWRWHAERPRGAATFLVGRGGAGPLSRRTIARRVADLARARLGAHVSPQQMRHAFAVHLLDGGASLRQVQTLLGHRTLGSTQTYSAVTRARLLEAHARAHPRGLP